MRKLISVLLVVLLLITATACDPESGTAGNDVTFAVSVSPKRNVKAEDGKVAYVDKVEWKYTAVKGDDAYTTGETTEEKELGDGDLTLSLGSWTITVNGYTGKNLTYTGTYDTAGKAITADTKIAVEVKPVEGVKDGDITFYDDLAKAVEGVADGGTITLIKDVEVKAAVTLNKNFTLDLGGKTVSISGSYSNNARVITNEGDLTVVNGTIEYKDAESFVWILQNNKKLKVEDVTINYAIKKTDGSDKDSTSVGVLNSRGEDISLERCKVTLSVPKTGTGIKLTAFYVSAGTFEINDSEIVAETVREGDIRGFYAYINSSSTSGVTGSIKNTKITVTSSAKGAVAPVFAESYCAHQAEIDIENCTLTATSSVADNGDRTTYCIRTKGPSTITIDDFTYDHCTVSGNTHEDGKLAKFGATAQSQSGATTEAQNKTGVIKRGDEVLAGSESGSN